MPMTVEVINLTGTAPGSPNPVSSITMNREDTASGTTGIAVPGGTAATGFSWVKTLQLNITVTASLTMSTVRVGKLIAEVTTGTKLWHVTSHASYTQASSSPAATSDNNITAPTLNGATATAVPIITTNPASYTGLTEYNSTGVVGNMVEVSLGVDTTCTASGSSVAISTLRWTWTEA